MAILRYGDYTGAARRVLGQVPLGQVPLAVRRVLTRRRDEYEELWQDILTAAQRDGAIRPEVDLHVARLFLLGALNGTVEWFRSEGKLPEKLTR